MKEREANTTKWKNGIITGTICAVPLCKNNRVKNKELSWHGFPKDPALRREWIRRVKRQGAQGKFSVWEPTKYHKICGVHFNKSGKKGYMDKLPIFFAWKDYTIATMPPPKHKKKKVPFATHLYSNYAQNDLLQQQEVDLCLRTSFSSLDLGSEVEFPKTMTHPTALVGEMTQDDIYQPAHVVDRSHKDHKYIITLDSEDPTNVKALKEQKRLIDHLLLQNSTLKTQNAKLTAENVSLKKENRDLEIKCKFLDANLTIEKSKPPQTIKFGFNTVAFDDKRMEFCESQDFRRYEVAQPRSPASPDHQYCSSTTQSLGDSVLGGTEEDMKEDLPRRLCLVCGDVASGFHYGVASCEACKAFFKRTIQGNIEYTCPACNECEINKRRRKACQACRFQKCLRMGMLKEGVRLDRVRGGRQKYRRNPELPYQLAPTIAQPVGGKPPPTLQDNKILEILVACEPEMVSVSLDQTSDPEHRVLSTLSDLYDKELVSIIGWAKQIPGFTELSLNDQMRLLQSTWAEILTLSLTFRSLSCVGKLRFAADFTMDEKQARDCNALELFQQCTQIVERIERLNVAKEEYLLMKALVLANSDVHMDECVSLKKFRDSILAALQDCVTVIRPNTALYHMQHLLLCLPALRQADAVIRRYWTTVHREGKIVMNKLFVEMLEACYR